MSVGSTERLRLYGISELLSLPEPKWLIDKLFTAGSVSVVYGASGHGKSFLALDWALSIASGEPWLGRGVEQGAVVYVAAEGGRSIRRRVAAWMSERGHRDVPEAFFLLEGVQVADEKDVELVCTRIGELQVEPALVVLDTLARCFVGGDENSAQEMGGFVEGLDCLRRSTGAAAMVLHHSGKQTPEAERGSTALRAAADVMIRVSKKGKLITIHNDKQKDDEEFKDIGLRLKQVPVDDDTSCVLEGCGTPANSSDPLPVRLRSTLQALAKSRGETVSTKDWATEAGRKDRTLHSHRRALVERGFVKEVKRGHYKLTEEGHALLRPAATAKHLHLVEPSRGPSRPAATATTP